MSDRDRAKADDGGGGGGDDEEGEGHINPKEKNCKGCKKKKSRKLSLFRLRKRKQSGTCANSECLGRRMVGGARWGSSCFRQSRSLDYSGESPTSDPNSSEFTFDMLRTLIEKNDFYSKECNPHLD